MKRVAVFGNTGGGKSTLARRLAEATGLPLYALDLIQFKAGGNPVPHDDYLKAHADIVMRENWIIDGYGDTKTAWQRFAAADTLIHVDLSLALHAWWVSKRFLKGLFVAPQGWPDNSPLWRSTLSSYRVLGLCHRHLTPKYRRLIAEQAAVKTVHHLRSRSEIETFLAEAKKKGRQAPALR